MTASAIYSVSPLQFTACIITGACSHHSQLHLVWCSHTLSKTGELQHHTYNVDTPVPCACPSQSCLPSLLHHPCIHLFKIPIYLYNYHTARGVETFIYMIIHKMVHDQRINYTYRPCGS